MLMHASNRSRTRNPGFRAMFAPDRMTLGVFFPIEAFKGDAPSMRNQAELARRAEAGGFAALWFRDVPLRDPSFGDIGQVFDPWVYLGYIAARTQRIALATGAIVLPIRHPIHTAKAAASVDQLSSGRLVLGVASGDRPVELPAFGVDAEQLRARFAEHLQVLNHLYQDPPTDVIGSFGHLSGGDVVPKPWADAVPLLVAGRSRQTLDWIAANSDGWITYPRSHAAQQLVAAEWRAAVERHRPGRFLPFAQSLYIDLDADATRTPEPIHLGFRVGRKPLLGLLSRLQSIGVHHVALNLKYGRRPADEVIEELTEFVTPEFPAHTATHCDDSDHAAAAGCVPEASELES